MGPAHLPSLMQVKDASQTRSRVAAQALASAIWLYAASQIAVSALALRLRMMEIVSEHRRQPQPNGS